MPGAPEPLYVAARLTLLDALEAIQAHLAAVVLVGAQAVYVHTGEGELAVAPYTTDADLALDPGRLAGEPLIQDLLRRADFNQSPTAVGAWGKEVLVEGVSREMVVDLLVPESLGGPGRRGARIPPHDSRAARKVRGLEGTLVDRDLHRIAALDPTDHRVFEISVAGPSGLLVAKIFKIHDRATHPDRRTDKDALDVLRLLQAIPTQQLVRRFRIIEANPLSEATTGEALSRIPELFGTAGSVGCAMAARAAAPFESESVISASTAALAGDLVTALRAGG